MSILKEDNGNYSMARVLSLTTVISGIVLGVIFALTDNLDSSGVQLSLGLVGLGIAGKTVSKRLEE